MIIELQDKEQRKPNLKTKSQESKLEKNITKRKKSLTLFKTFSQPMNRENQPLITDEPVEFVK